jgi:uncharacterized membrane protein
VSLPSVNTVMKATAMTAVALIIINVVKPYIPEPVRKLLG